MTSQDWANAVAAAQLAPKTGYVVVSAATVLETNKLLEEEVYTEQDGTKWVRPTAKNYAEVYNDCAKWQENARQYKQRYLHLLGELLAMLPSTDVLAASRSTGSLLRYFKFVLSVRHLQTGALRPFATMEEADLVGTVFQGKGDEEAVLHFHRTGKSITLGDFRRAQEIFKNSLAFLPDGN